MSINIDSIAYTQCAISPITDKIDIITDELNKLKEEYFIIEKIQQIENINENSTIVLLLKENIDIDLAHKQLKLWQNIFSNNKIIMCKDIKEVLTIQEDEYKNEFLERAYR